MASGKHFKYVILGGGVAAVRARAPSPALRLLPIFRLVSVLPPPTFWGFLFRRFFTRSMVLFVILPDVPAVPLVCL